MEILCATCGHGIDRPICDSCFFALTESKNDVALWQKRAARSEAALDEYKAENAELRRRVAWKDKQLREASRDLLAPDDEGVPYFDLEPPENWQPAQDDDG